MSDSKNEFPKDRNLNSDDETKTSIPNSNEISESDHPKRIGQYTIKRVIASGGMGTVFEALQENPKRPVAIKVIRIPEQRRQNHFANQLRPAGAEQ